MTRNTRQIKLKRENAQKTLNIKTKKCTRENGTLNKIEQCKKKKRDAKETKTLKQH